MKEKLNKRNEDKSSNQDATGDWRGERLLQLSLPALVQGEKASCQRFCEETELITINSKIVTFLLKAPVRIGCPLKIAINIPATALLIHPLRLEIKGQVARLELDGQKKPSQLVTVELDYKFELRSQICSSQLESNCS